MTDTAASREAAAPGRQGFSSQKLGELIFALLALGLGVFVLVGAFGIRAPGSGTQVGPRVFPYLVSAILILSAAMVVIGILRGRLADQEESEDIDAGAKTDWVTLAKLVGFVIAHLVLIDLIGWMLAAAVLFGGVAWSLGAKKWWVALLTGLALGFVVQLVFGGFLGLSLPLGPLMGWTEPFFRMMGN